MSSEISLRKTVTMDQIAPVKEHIAPGSSDAELQLFLYQVNRTGLDPFSKQIYCIRRYNPAQQKETATYQVAIDGLRLIAERTGQYDGQEGPWFCGKDGIWTDIWTSDTPPFAAKSFVFRKGITRPFSGIAYFSAYVSRKKDGSVTAMWAKMPAHMIAKCSEALALRKAFPQETSGIYAEDEMDTIDVKQEDTNQPPLPTQQQQAQIPPTATASRPRGRPPQAAPIQTQQQKQEMIPAAETQVSAGAIVGTNDSATADTFFTTGIKAHSVLLCSIMTHMGYDRNWQASNGLRVCKFLEDKKVLANERDMTGAMLEFLQPEDQKSE